MVVAGRDMRARSAQARAGEGEGGTEEPIPEGVPVRSMAEEEEEPATPVAAPEEENGGELAEPPAGETWVETLAKKSNLAGRVGDNRRDGLGGRGGPGTQR